MKKLRDILVLLAMAAAFAFALAQFARLFGIASAWFGVMLMFDFLGLVAFARPLFLLKLPDFLRRERVVETRGTLYKAMRVPAFGALLRRTPLRHLNPLVYLKQGSDSAGVQAQIESAEAAHLAAAALLVPYMAVACAKGQWTALFWMMVLQAGFNAYPVMHLRWVRIRMHRIRIRMAPVRTGAT